MAKRRFLRAWWFHVAVAGAVVAMAIGGAFVVRASRSPHRSSQSRIADHLREACVKTRYASEGDQQNPTTTLNEALDEVIAAEQIAGEDVELVRIPAALHLGLNQTIKDIHGIDPTAARALLPDDQWYGGLLNTCRDDV